MLLRRLRIVQPRLHIETTVEGRVLLLQGSSVAYVARGYEILRSEDRGRSWSLDAIVPASRANRTAASIRLAARLLRREITAFRVLGDGSRIAVARDGFYRADPGILQMVRTIRFSVGRPLTVAIDDRDRIVFGDYHANASRGPMAIHVSNDGGRSFSVAFEFRPGQVRHIHAVVWDRYLRRCLVLTGDYGEECGIGVLDPDFSSVDWIARGGQRFRAAAALVGPDAITYGTDTHVEQNEILRLDKNTGRVETLALTDGSSLFASRFGDIQVISTCVEPSRVNLSRNVSLYVSRNGEDWASSLDVRKDMWNATYFQFGTLVLPHADVTGGWGAFSGQAVRRFDGRTCFFSMSEAAGN